MKNKIKRKHPAFWLIRHRSGNIRDHPQRYHINVGKKYRTGNFRSNKRGSTRIAQSVNRREIEEWANNIAYNYNHDIDTDIPSQLIDASRDLGIPFHEMDKRWQDFYPSDKVTKDDIIWLIAGSDTDVKRSKSGHYRIKNWKKMKDDEWKYDPELEEYELPFGDPPIFMYKRLRPKVPITPKTVVRVRVRGASWSDNPWVIKMVTEDGYVHTMDKSFKTKSEAIKFAVDWMKKHPNGV